MSSLYYLLVAEACSFLIHLLSQTQSVRTLLVPYHSLCSTCLTYRTSCYVFGHQILSMQSKPRKAEDFPRGSKNHNDVPLPTFLAYLQPVQSIILDWYLHVLKSWMLLVVVKRLANYQFKTVETITHSNQQLT